ncbi:PRC-barrel domain-containing protein [Salinarimonas soli]|uniref:PRC-barrel domain-containing protein n=1 Tax=Salinarimonas soli TaxID=1638099 RepID=A0A5B2VES4_9HYPH|nr:PRC-barrel domain-containing protein [Salinarimonas soli]KAA2237335.1 hypothetical protein F0L46_10065 [Salinarimonas soli]
MSRVLIASLFASTGLVSIAAAQTPLTPVAASACERLVQTVETRQGEALPVSAETARAYRTAGDDGACREALARMGETTIVTQGAPVRVDPSRIVVQPAAPAVQVQSAAPQIAVQQPQPNVSVGQPRPEIVVRQPAPTVTVDMPQPEIIVRMPDPAVNVALGTPQVEVRQPQVRYERAEPRVVVNQAPGEPTVRFEAAPPAPALPALAQAQSPQVQPLQVQPAPALAPPVSPPALQAAPQTPPPAAEVPRLTAESVPPVPLAAGAVAERAETQTPAAPVQGRQLGARELEDMRVHSAAGDLIGEVDDVLIGPADQTFLVVTYGGFLAIGERQVLLPLSRMRVQDDRLVADMTAQELRAQTPRQGDAPGYRQAGADFRAPASLTQGDPAMAAYGTAPVPAATGGIQSPPAAGTQQVAVSRLKDLKLYTVQGQALGEIERVVQGPDGGFRLVVSHGGFLGLGERHVMVPAGQVALRDDRLVARDLADDQLKALPTASRNDSVFRDIPDEQQVPVGNAP